MHLRLHCSLRFSVVVLTVLATVAARADDDGDRAAFRVWPGVSGGARIGFHVDDDHAHAGLGAAGATTISFSLPLLSFVEPDVTVGFGLGSVDHGTAFDPTRDIEMVNRFSFGLRLYAPPLGGAFDLDAPARPFLWGALHHGHKVTLENTLKNPIGAVLTATEAGVHHLTGVEAGGGILLGVDVDGHRYPILLRGSLSWLPSFAALHSGGVHGDDVYALVDVAVGLPVRLNDP